MVFNIEDLLNGTQPFIPKKNNSSEEKKYNEIKQKQIEDAKYVEIKAESTVLIVHYNVDFDVLYIGPDGKPVKEENSTEYKKLTNEY